MTRPIITGTSTSGPITAAKAAPVVDPEHGHRHGNGQLEVVAGGRERKRGRLGVVGPDLAAHEEADQEHHDEVDQQRHGDQHDVQRNLHDLLALAG